MTITLLSFPKKWVVEMFNLTENGNPNVSSSQRAHGWNVAAGRRMSDSRFVSQALKLFTASSSDSYVSNTVSSFVIASRSVMRLVRLTSLSLPPCRLTVVYVRTISPSPALST